jgi:hypothetical protein
LATAVRTDSSSQAGNSLLHIDDIFIEERVAGFLQQVKGVLGSGSALTFRQGEVGVYGKNHVISFVVGLRL